MIERNIHITLLLFLLLFSSACSHKTVKTSIQEENLTAYTVGDYEIETLSKELPKALSIPLHTKDFNPQNSALDEITLIKLDHALKLILNGMIFEPNSATPVENAVYIVQDLTSILKKYPHVVIQVTGHSDSLEKTSHHQDLSDNRAISIAEILYKLDTKNETYAKGCSDKKPLFIDNNQSDDLSNARVEITLYGNKENMIDQCQ